MMDQWMTDGYIDRFIHVLMDEWMSDGYKHVSMSDSLMDRVRDGWMDIHLN
jgi:hypothetical protein